MTRSEQKQNYSVYRNVTIFTHLNGISIGSIRLMKNKIDFLLPDITTTFTLFSVKQNPSVFMWNKRSVNNVMRWIDRLFNRTENISQSKSKTNSTHCVNNSILFKSEQRSRIQMNVNCSIAVSYTEQTIFTLETKTSSDWHKKLMNIFLYHFHFIATITLTMWRIFCRFLLRTIWIIGHRFRKICMWTCSERPIAETLFSNTSSRSLKFQMSLMNSNWIILPIRYFRVTILTLTARNTIDQFTKTRSRIAIGTIF